MDTTSAASPDQMSSITTLVVFVLTYIALAAGSIPGLRIDRTGIAIVGAAAMLALGSISFKDAMVQTDWGTIIVLMSLMIIVAQLTESAVLSKVAARIVPRTLSPRLTLGLSMAVTASTSALITNDVAVLAFIPILIARLHARGLHPIPFILGCTFAANIGSAATIIGNPQNMIVAEALEIDFVSHFLWAIVPVLVALVIVWVFVQFFCGPLTHSTAPPKDKPATVDITSRVRTAPTTIRPINALLGILALVAVITLFILDFPRPIVAICVAGLLLLNRVYSTDTILGRVDWSLLVLVVALGIVVGAFARTGLPAEGVSELGDLGINFSEPWQLAIGTVVLSNLVNNIPAVMLLLKVVPGSTPDLGLILAVASTFAGNFIIVGSLANMIMVRQAHEHGITITFWRHARAGIPITILSTLVLLGWILITT